MTDTPQPDIGLDGVGICHPGCPLWCGGDDDGKCWETQRETTRYDVCLPWARGDGIRRGALADKEAGLELLRARLRAVQRAARRMLSCPEMIDFTTSTGRWMLHVLNRGTCKFDNYSACPHCYRALPVDGECRCGGGHA